MLEVSSQRAAQPVDPAATQPTDPASAGPVDPAATGSLPAPPAVFDGAIVVDPAPTTFVGTGF